VIGVGVFALVIGIGGAAAFWKLNGNIASAALDKNDHVVKDDTPKGATNILFIGSDSRQLKSKGYGNEAGQRSDALMLVHFAKDNKRVEAVQIPRDTLTTLPACKDTGSGAFPGGANLMINSALAGFMAVALGLELARVRADEQDVGRTLGGVVLHHVVLLLQRLRVDVAVELPVGGCAADADDQREHADADDQALPDPLRAASCAPGGGWRVSARHGVALLQVDGRSTAGRIT